jgi:Glu-tRNA(Gln) amidotransferase subunit E-like FAD-binding protein
MIKPTRKKSIDGEYGPVPATARAYKAVDIGSIVVGDEIMVKVHQENMRLWNHVILVFVQFL